MAKPKKSEAAPLRGVNLGGWLVLEKWITPSLFEGTEARDEYSFCESADKVRLRKLRNFRNSFITEADIMWLAERGVQAVRLPIGYWVFGGEAPYEGTIQYVDALFAWAKKAGVKVLIDLHGAPGSQNGWDHSGQAGAIRWHTSQDNTVKLLSVIKNLAERYGKHSQLLGIELMNEPKWTVPKRALKWYYIAAYKIIRAKCRKGTWVVIHDGFRPRRWRRVLRGRKYQDVYIDTHHYQCFSQRDKSRNIWEHLELLMGAVPRKLKHMGKYHPVIVGEWSLALDARSTGKLLPVQGEAANRMYAGAQLMAYSETKAWFFWTYKIEHGTAWSYRRAVEQGLLPVSGTAEK